MDSSSAGNLRWSNTAEQITSNTHATSFQIAIDRQVCIAAQGVSLSAFVNWTIRVQFGCAFWRQILPPVPSLQCGDSTTLGAIATVGGGVLKLFTIPLIETGMVWNSNCGYLSKAGAAWQNLSVCGTNTPATNLRNSALGRGVILERNQCSKRDLLPSTTTI